MDVGKADFPKFGRDLSANLLYRRRRETPTVAKLAKGK
jgi:hypothetical protein